MATAAAAKVTSSAKSRLKLVRELLQLRKDNEAIYKREEELKADLKAIAGGLGENFKETIPGLGSVSVAPPKDKQFKGTMPEVVGLKWTALTDAQRKKYLEGGVIAEVEQWSGAYYGAVTVKLF